MNNHVMDKKISQDVNRVKEDLGKLETDVAAQVVGTIEDHVNQATDGLNSWIGSRTSKLNNSVGKMTGNAKKTVIKTTESVKKDVGQRLSRYNSRAQYVANKVPGGLGKKAARYPWVGMSLSLIIGVLLGSFLKPAHKHLDPQ